MYVFIEVLISILISIIPTIIYIIKKDKNKKYLIIGSILLLIGCFVRLLLIHVFPVGLNQDEASIGYDAYSILNYGIDRSGNSYPVHLNAWGSGQNALYAYLLLPFIKLFGLNTFSLRLPSALISSFTLLIAYYLFKDNFKDKGLIYLFFLVIMPWHIMKSRWALESNIFPDFIFYSIALIYYGIKTKKKIFYILSSIILGISTYAYGTSYAFVPMFSILVYIYLIKSKKIRIKDALLYLIITGVVSFPVILFVIINNFNFRTIKIFNITIPKLDYARFAASNLEGNKILYILKNLLLGIFTFIYQADGSSLNTISIGGIFYRISFPFIIYGIYKSYKSKDVFIKLINCFFISSIFVSFFIVPNINRINVLWIPCIIYLSFSLLLLIKDKKYIKYVIMIYSLFFISFNIYYFTKYQNTLNANTYNGYVDALKFTKNLKYEKMYIKTEVNQPYIYYLFEYKINPKEYFNNRTVLNQYTKFQTISSINNTYFNSNIHIDKNNVYIIEKKELKYYNVDDYKVKTFKNYIVVY